MTSTTSLITSPIALCAYVLSLVFGLLAKMWKSKHDKGFDRPLFRLAVFLSVTALVGGLTLAWYQTPRAAAPSASPPQAGTAAIPNDQTSYGCQAPNVQNSSGVTIQYGGTTNCNAASPNPPASNPNPPAQDKSSKDAK
jgi:hypothetical protein